VLSLFNPNHKSKSLEAETSCYPGLSTIRSQLADKTTKTWSFNSKLHSERLHLFYMSFTKRQAKVQECQGLLRQILSEDSRQYLTRNQLSS